MSSRFEIRLQATEGALLRTLSLIQRRGFEVREMALRPAGGEQRLKVSLADNSRDVAVLRRQIERLHDVVDVRPLTSLTPARARPGWWQSVITALAPRPRVATRGAGA